MKKTLMSYTVIVDEAGQWTPLTFFPTFRDIVRVKTARKMLHNESIKPGIYNVTVENKYFGLLKVYRYEGTALI